MCCRFPLHLVPLAHEQRQKDPAPDTFRTPMHVGSLSLTTATLAHGLKALIVAGAVALGLGLPALLGVAAQGAEAQVSAEAAGYVTIDTEQLAEMFDDKTFFLVNVHIPYEGEIDGTDANIAFDAIADNLDKLPADKAAEIVLYCRSGRMSQIASRTLAGLGYTNVTDVAGGMNSWRKDGGEIVFK